MTECKHNSQPFALLYHESGTVSTTTLFPYIHCHLPTAQNISFPHYILDVLCCFTLWHLIGSQNSFHRLGHYKNLKITLDDLCDL